MKPLPVMGAVNCSDVQRQNRHNQGHYDKTVRTNKLLEQHHIHKQQDATNINGISLFLLC